MVSLYDRKVLSRKDVIDIIKANYEYKAVEKAADSDINYFDANVPFVKVIKEESKTSKRPIVSLLWDTKPNDCWQNMATKKPGGPLPETVMKIIQDLNISTLLVGKGTTCRAIVKSIFDSASCVKMICTANLLIACEAIRRKTELSVWMPKGTLDRKSAYLQGEAVEELGNQAVDGSLTSFMGVKFDMSENLIKFYGNNFEEAKDKHMNLNPHIGCRNTIIALGWKKLNKGGVFLLDQNALDENRQYTFVIDMSESGPDDKESESKWQILNKLEAMPNVKVKKA